MFIKVGLLTEEEARDDEKFKRQLRWARTNMKGMSINRAGTGAYLVDPQDFDRHWKMAKVKLDHLKEQRLLKIKNWNLQIAEDKKNNLRNHQEILWSVVEQEKADKAAGIVRDRKRRKANAILNGAIGASDAPSLAASSPPPAPAQDVSATAAPEPAVIDSVEPAGSGLGNVGTSPAPAGEGGASAGSSAAPLTQEQPEPVPAASDAPLSQEQPEPAPAAFDAPDAPATAPAKTEVSPTGEAHPLFYSKSFTAGSKKLQVTYTAATALEQRESLLAERSTWVAESSSLAAKAAQMEEEAVEEAGGNPERVSDELSEEILRIAEEAKKASNNAASCLLKASVYEIVVERAIVDWRCAHLR